MAKQFHLSPRQMRALVILLLLLPLVPTAILGRAMIESALRERREIRDSLFDFQRTSLHSIIALVANRLSPENTDLSPISPNNLPPNAGWTPNSLNQLKPNRWSSPAKGTHSAFRTPEGKTYLRPTQHLLAQIESELRSFLHDDLPLCGRNKNGTILIGKPIPPNENLRLLETTSSNLLPIHEIQTLERLEPFEQHASLSQVRTGFLITAAVLTIVILGSLLAGFAITRQLRTDELRNDALAAFSHEMKTPIAASRLLIDTLTEQKLTSKKDQSEYLDLLGHENDRMSALTETFLLHTRLANGTYPLQIKPTNPNQLATDTLRDCLPLAEKQNATLNPPETNHPDIPADPNALSIALTALLTNALTHGKPTSAPHTVTLDLTTTESHLHFDVLDHGPGIPENERQKITEQFYQIDRKLNTPNPGCGLGLNIARQLIEAHHGTLTFANRSDNSPGTRARIAIPLTQPIS